MVDATDHVFTGQVAEIYEQYLVPLIFEPYAMDLANRLRGMAAGAILETAAGTGVVTRAMAATLPEAVSITATDLNPGMIEQGKQTGTSRSVTWEQADVLALPYDSSTFDAVVCQFGVMFFPDRAGAFAEARRVLRPGGQLLFNAWDRIETNEFADVVTQAVATMFPDDPPRFLRRTPHGYHDPHTIRADLRAGGFHDVRIEVVDARSRAANAEAPAIAYCQGTPLRDEIEARGPGRLDEATGLATDAIAYRYGATEVDGLIRALVVSAST